MSRTIKRVSLAYVLLAVVALFIGTLFGPLQALDHARINAYPWLRFFALRHIHRPQARFTCAPFLFLPRSMLCSPYEEILSKCL